MSIDPPAEQAFPERSRDRWRETVGWLLFATGAIWTAAALWAVLFVMAEDRNGTELITALVNPLIPAVLLIPGTAIIRAGLRWLDLSTLREHLRAWTRP